METERQRAEVEKRWKEREGQAKKQRLLDSFTLLDYELLKMRKAGASWYAISKKLDVGIMYACYKLQMMEDSRADERLG